MFDSGLLGLVYERIHILIHFNGHFAHVICFTLVVRSKASLLALPVRRLGFWTRFQVSKGLKEFLIFSKLSSFDNRTSTRLCQLSWGFSCNFSFILLLNNLVFSNPRINLHSSDRPEIISRQPLPLLALSNLLRLENLPLDSVLLSLLTLDRNAQVSLQFLFFVLIWIQP